MNATGSGSHAAPDFDFLSGPGEMRALMRMQDWSASPLGHPRTWSPALRTVTGLMLDSKFPMFVAWGPELGFLYNDSYIEVLGAKHPTAIGRRFHDIWFEIWDVIDPLIRRALAGEASFHENLPLQMLRKGHLEQTWFTFSYSPARDETGRIAGMFCACTETTGRVLAERRQEFQLRLADRLRGVGDPAAIAATSAEAIGRQLGAARVGYARLRAPDYRMAVAGEWTDGRLPPLDGDAPSLPAFGEHALHGLRQGRTLRIDDVRKPPVPDAVDPAAMPGAKALLAVPLRKAGRLHALMYLHDAQPRRWTDDEVMLAEHVAERTWYALELARAEAQRRQAEEALTAQLAAERNRLRELFEQAPGFMAVVRGPEHVFELVNAAYMRLIGPRPVIGLPVRKALPELADQPFFDQLDQVYRSGRPYFESEARLVIRRTPEEAPSERFVDFVYQPVTDAEGRVTGIFVEGYDVTERRQALEALRVADRRKDEFLAMLAHELRNPLAPISNAAELLRLQSADNPRVARTSEIIGRQVAHMSGLVDDLLDVARVTSGMISLDRQVLDLRSVVDGAVEQVRGLIETRRHRLTVQADEESLFVFADRTRLVQVLANLLNNAAKYTPEGGELSVHIRGDARDAWMAVSDNGAGISAALQPHVFELFTQAERSPDRSQGGLGLGLALVRSLVELHEGSVSVHSEGLGKGSVFTVRLPRFHPASAPDEERAAGPGPRADGAPLKVMVVDDNVDAAESLAMLLDAAGYRTATRFSGEQALQAADAFRPRVFLLDVGLPDMDGYELARRLRAAPVHARAVLVALTGYGQPNDFEQSRQAGFDHHLVKPAKLADVLAILAGLANANEGNEGNA
ncbi:hybrid sensor histidine kinase/response regulator [Noviherbaspirillum aridicola]|uniref:histidine kinase n=1 Tax=Noviherbaspirillum aridicola TaxID=2849687 RepID=A0ABQ4Q2Q0_9BURK|nr:ATP-binding protein [Noviherbaspirillum aridicola]GIZ51435.1 hypothetical protein NCCP691_14490 [Noviherbaspirillum aridicola]